MDTNPLKGVVSAPSTRRLRAIRRIPAMQLADYSPPLLPVCDRAPQVFSGQNQKAYLRLKLALSLNLRRQIFIAVCDDLALRNRIAARLYAELAYPSPKPRSTDISTDIAANPRPSSAGNLASFRENRLSVMVDEQESASTLAKAALPPQLLYPRLVSLNLSLSDPNPMVQIAAWLAQYPPPPHTPQRLRSPGFQILGIERLTRQTAPVQKHFLHSLQQIESYLACLESPLLLWLPRPWLNAIQQSAPDFWHWHTALFEFEGDPTPAPSVAVRLEAHPEAVAAQKKSPTEAVPPQAIAVPIVPQSAADEASLRAASQPDQPAVPIDAVVDPDRVEPAIAIVPPKENLWEILSHDLALLDAGRQNPSPDAEPLDTDATERATVDLSQAMAAAVSPFRVDALLLQQDGETEDVMPLVSASMERSDSSSVMPAIAAVTPTAVTLTAEQPAILSIETPDQNQAALALADLILAVATEDAGDTPSSQNASIIQALQQIEQLHLQQAPRATLLAAYQNLGNLCRDRIEQGNASPQHLLLTICVYEQTLAWLDEASLLWSDVLNDIGNLYWMLSRQEPDIETSLTYLEQAIAAYQQALSKTNPETRPHNYAMIQNNLGSAYGDLARFQAPAASLQQSVAAYESALRYRQLHDDPARYAATQNNLGTAYWNLAQYQQPVRRLKQSIAAYFEALRYYSPDCEPMHYAMIQNNLGTAYWNLAQQPQANLGVGTATGKALAATDLLQRAIGAYRAALRYRTLEVAPAAYAATQNNLGTAYWQLASLLENQPEQRRDHLQKAIAAYKAAIAAVQSLTEINPAPALSFDPSATHNNLGLAYHQLATDQHQRDATQRSSNLEAALAQHLQALQGWEPQSEFYQTVFSYVLQTLRTFHNELGSKGQTLALSQVPANLLPDVLKQL